MAGARGPEPAGGGPAWRGRCGPNPAGPAASPERPRTGRENGRRGKRSGVLPAAGCRAEGARGCRGSCGTSGPSSAGPGRAAPRQNVKGAAPARPPGDGRLPHTGANGRFCRRPGVLCTRPRRRPRGSIRRGPAAPSSRKAGPTAVSPAVFMNPRLSACRDGHARLSAGGRCLERRPLRRAAAAGHHFRPGAHPITPGRPPHRALPADVRVPPARLPGHPSGSTLPSRPPAAFRVAILGADRPIHAHPRHGCRASRSLTRLAPGFRFCGVGAGSASVLDPCFM